MHEPSSCSCLDCPSGFWPLSFLTRYIADAFETSLKRILQISKHGNY